MRSGLIEKAGNALNEIVGESGYRVTIRVQQTGHLEPGDSEFYGQTNAGLLRFDAVFSEGLVLLFL
jgi:hypothetical protein